MGINPDVLFYCINEDLYENDPLVDSESATVTPRRFAMRALQSSFLKKFRPVDCSVQDNKAIDLFLEVNASMKGLEIKPETLLDELLLGEFSSSLYRYVYSGLESLTLGDLLDHGKVGPGASLGAVGGDFYSKLFASTLTVTSPGLYTAYKQYMDGSPTTKQAEINRLSFCRPYRLVDTSRLTCVPKSSSISRTICTEPNLNMYYQLGLKDIMEECLRRNYGIDLTYQQFRNRELARRGSIDGSFSTIDLSSASDTVSLTLINKFIPKPLRSWLNLLRTPKTILPDGREIVLNMVSTMGNGTTFPLQTAIFCAVVESAYSLLDIKLQRPTSTFPGNFGVNGDDIVCVTQATSLIHRLLKILGFRVNTEKSFSEGPFRESCGGDYFQGYPVRGVYCQYLSSPQDRLSLLNRLVRWCSLHGVILRRTLNLLYKSCPKLFVPPTESDVSGIHVPYSFVLGKRLFRSRNLSACYKRFEPVLFGLKVLDDSIRVPKGSKRRPFNYEGLLASFLRGTVRDHFISIRPDRVKYRVRRVITPSWDYLPDGHPLSGDVGWDSWEAVLESIVR